MERKLIVGYPKDPDENARLREIGQRDAQAARASLEEREEQSWIFTMGEALARNRVIEAEADKKAAWAKLIVTLTAAINIGLAVAVLYLAASALEYLIGLFR